jgi:Protein of unknown function (DUF3667)
MQPTNCLNCGTDLQTGQRFCGQCGQQAAIHRFSVPHFLHEFFHAFTHADKGIFHLLKSLATRPGTTAREYINGRRKAYFSPFTFFLIIMGIYVLANAFFVKAPPEQEPDPQVLAHIPTEEGRQTYIGMLTRGNKVAHFMTKSANIVAMVAVPLIALITWLFFRRRRYNYAEHLTANLLFVVFSNLVFVILIFPLDALFKGHFFTRYFPFIGMFLQALYLFWCLNGFLELKSAGQRTKSLLVSFFAIVLWFVCCLTLMALYIYQSWDFYKFYGRMF